MRVLSTYFTCAAALAVAVIATPTTLLSSVASHALAPVGALQSAVVHGAAAGALGAGRASPQQAPSCLKQRCLVTPSSTSLRNQNCCDKTFCDGPANDGGVIVGVCSVCVAAGHTCIGPGECCGLNVCLNMQTTGSTRRGVCGRPFNAIYPLPSSTTGSLTAPSPAISSSLVIPSLPLVTSTSASISSSSSSSFSSSFSSFTTSSSSPSSSTFPTTAAPTSSTTTSSSTSSSTTSSVGNLFVNPGFEASNNYYAPWDVEYLMGDDAEAYGVNQVVPPPTAGAHTGTNSLVIRVGIDSMSGSGDSWSVAQVTTTQAGSYMFSIWVQGGYVQYHSGCNPTVSIFAQAGNQYEDIMGPLALDGLWHQFTSTWASTGETLDTGFVVLLQYGGTSNMGCVLDFALDDASITLQ